MNAPDQASVTREGDPENKTNNPFPGPVPLTNRQPVFGRDREISELRGLLLSERIVVLHGVSGAGKSSILRGKGGICTVFNNERNFSVLGPVEFRLSDSNTFAENGYEELLLDQLNRQLPDGQRKDNEMLWESLDLDIFLMRHSDHNPNSHQLLIIDQFEDIFTQHSEDETGKEKFFQKLGEVLDSNPELYLLLSMRDEYLGELDHYRRYLPGRFRATQRLELLRREQAADAIMRTVAEEPWCRRLCHEDVDSLVVRLSRVSSPRGAPEEGAPGYVVEPLFLQLVCNDAWERLDPMAPLTSDGCTTFARDLTRDDLDQVLASFYRRALYDVCGEGHYDEYKLRCLVHDGLISSKGLRGLLNEDEALRTWGVDGQKLRALVDEHLIRLQRRNQVVYFELAHDRLVEPISADNRAWLEHQQPWRRAARRYHLGSEGDEHLGWLNLFIALGARRRAPDSLAPYETQYISHQKRRLYRTMTIAGLYLTTVAFVGGAVTWFTSQQVRDVIYETKAYNQNIKERLIHSDNRAKVFRAISSYIETKWVERDDQSAVEKVLDAYQLSKQLFPKPAELSQFENVLFTAFNNSLSLTSGAPGYSHTLKNLGHTGLPYDFHAGRRPLVAYLDEDCVMLTSLREITEPRCLLRTDSTKIGIIRFSPDGALLAIGLDETILLLDTVSGNHVSEIPGRADVLQFSPGGAMLSLAFRDQVRVLCRLEDSWLECRRGRIDIEANDFITQLDLSSEASTSRVLVVGTKHGIVSLYRLPEARNDLDPLGGFDKPERIYSRPLTDDRQVKGLHVLDTNPMRLVVVHADTQIFAIFRDSDGSLKRHPIEPDIGSQLYGARSEQDNDHYTGVAFSADHVLYVTLEDAIDTWDLNRLSFEQERTDKLMMPMLRHVTGGRNLSHLTVGHDYVISRGYFHTWVWERHVKGASKLSSVKLPRADMPFLKGRVYYPQSVVSVDGREVVAGTTQHGLQHWTTDAEGKWGFTELGPCWRQPRSVRAVALSRERRLVAAASSHKQLMLASLDRPDKPQCDKQQHGDGLWSVAFDRTSEWLVSGDWVGKLVLWHVNEEGHMQRSDLVTPQNSSSRITSKNAVMALAFHPKEDLLAVGLRGGDVYLYALDMQSGRLNLSHKLAFQTSENVGSVLDLDFSHDGSLLAAAGGKGPVQVWEFSTDKYTPRSPMIGHAGGTRAVAFNPDGTRLVSGGADGILRIWSSRDLNRTPAMLRNLDADLLSVGWAPDGRSLIASYKEQPQLLLPEGGESSLSHGSIVTWQWNLDFFARTACGVLWGESEPASGICSADEQGENVAAR